MPQQGDSTQTPGPAVRRASVLPTGTAAPGSPPQGLLTAAGRPAPPPSGPAATATGSADTETAASAAGAGTEPAAAPAVPGEPKLSPAPRGGTAPEGTPAGEAPLPAPEGAPAAEAPLPASEGAPAAEASLTGTVSGRGHDAPETPAQPRTATGSAAPPGVPESAAASSRPAAPEEGRTATHGGEPSHGRPGKPLLAAAAIAGAVLVGVPFLLLGTGADDRPPAGAGRAQPVGGTLLEGGGPDAAPGSDGYIASTPVPPEKAATTPAAGQGKESESAAPAAGQKKKSEAGPQARTTPTTPHASAPGSPNRPAKAAAPARRKATGRSLPQGADFRTTTRVLIKNVMTGLCVDVPYYGKGRVDGPVNQYTCDRTGDNQLWDLVVAKENAGPAGADLFTIRNSLDGYCLDLPAYGGRAARTPVSEYHCNGTTADNQLWYLDKKSAGKFWIRSHSSGNLCLDVSGFYGSGGRDARLTIFDCDLKDDHLWSFS